MSTASPFDTKTVSDGAHTISAAVELSGGGTEAVHAPFTVANSAAPVNGMVVRRSAT